MHASLLPQESGAPQPSPKLQVLVVGPKKTLSEVSRSTYMLPALHLKVAILPIVTLVKVTLPWFWPLARVGSTQSVYNNIMQCWLWSPMTKWAGMTGQTFSGPEVVAVDRFHSYGLVTVTMYHAYSVKVSSFCNWLTWPTTIRSYDQGQEDACSLSNEVGKEEKGHALDWIRRELQLGSRLGACVCGLMALWLAIGQLKPDTVRVQFPQNHFPLSLLSPPHYLD